MADDTNTAGLKALQEYLKDCDDNAIVPDVGGAWHAAFQAGRASLAASAGSTEINGQLYMTLNNLFTHLGMEGCITADHAFVWDAMTALKRIDGGVHLDNLAVPVDPDAHRDDMLAAVQLLEDGEWAEHFAKTPIGMRLEDQITKLHSEVAASAGSEPVIGWHAFPHYLQHPDGRLLRTASDLLARHGYTGCAEPLRAMSDVLLSTNPSPPEGSAPAAPPMDGEIALIEKAVKRVGIKSLLNHGAGSLVYSEGVEGVTQDDLLAYTREIALHCAVALGSTPGKMAGWRPIATAPEGQMVVVGWLDPEDHETPERHDFDLLEDGCWQKWHDHAEHVEVIGGHGVSYTPPYTCWLPVPPLPASEAKEL